MSSLAGVPKETVIFFDPVSGEETSMVRIAPIERKMVVAIPNGTVRQPVTDPNDPNVVATNFQDLNQPFAEKDRIEVIKQDIVVLRPFDDAEAAVFQIGEIERAVGNTRFDNRTLIDLLHNRAAHEVVTGLGIGGVPGTLQRFGNQGVGDVASSTPFILAGGEEFIVVLVSNLVTGFVANLPDPLDPDNARVAIPVMFRISGFKLGKPTSADANAGRSAAIPVGRGDSIPTSHLSRAR